VSDTSYCRRKFKIICNSKTIGACFNKICILAYYVICLFSGSTAEDKNWLLVTKIKLITGFSALGFN
jgi:hypothetical protein